MLFILWLWLLLLLLLAGGVVAAVAVVVAVVAVVVVVVVVVVVAVAIAIAVAILEFLSPSKSPCYVWPSHLWSRNPLSVVWPEACVWVSLDRARCHCGRYRQRSYPWW